jgi:uncharacterized protein with NRDE domain
MCLAVIALNAHADWPLLIIANRDEYHERPTATAEIWQVLPGVLAGRDLRAGGTWLGVSATGKIGLLTNYREPGTHNPAAPSRGELVGQYLAQSSSADAYIQSVQQQSESFNGFNLLLADTSGVLYFSNRTTTPKIQVSSGVTGLSNATLGVAWPKVVRTQNAVRAILASTQQPDVDALFSIFRDSKPANAMELPQTGLSAERELKLSSPFIQDDLYGTRCSTLIMKDHAGRIYFEERSFNPQADMTHCCKWRVDSVRQTITALP